MRILIIASGRSGSSQLVRLISDFLNLKMINEPFNYDFHDNIVNDPNVKDFNFRKLENNIIVKCIPSRTHWPFHPKPTTSVQTQNKMRISFFTEFSKAFDKVFIMDRDNTAKQFFSVMHAHKHNTWGGKYEFKPCTIDLEDYNWMEDFFNIKHELRILKEKINNSVELTYEYLYHPHKETSKSEFSKITEVNNKEFDQIYNDWLNPKHKCNINFG
jgi:hypothetical protein